MRLNLALTIYRKELRETLRDRRTLLMMIGVPLLIYPLMILAVTMVAESRQQALSEKTLPVAVWGSLPEEVTRALRARDVEIVGSIGLPSDLARDLADGRLRKPERPERKQDAAAPPEPTLLAARHVIVSHEARAVVIAWPGFERALEEGRLGQLTVYHDSVDDVSQAARERVVAALEEARAAIVEQRERERGLAPGFARAIDVTVSNVASRQRAVGGIVGGLLPLILIVVSGSGGFYAAIDLTAGEKERNTMQTLLCAPLRPTEIILGKFLAVWTIVMVTGLANVVSMAATLSRVGTGIGGLALPASTYALAFFALLPVAATMSGLFLAVAVFARDFKDGQNLLTPVLLLVMAPAGMSAIPGLSIDPVTAFVPIVNVALAIKAIFIGSVSVDVLFLTALAATTYAVLTLLLAARIFGREQVLLGGREGVRALLGIDEWKGRAPSPGLALSLFACLLVLMFYGGMAFERSGPLSMLVATQLLFIGLPLAAVSLGLRVRLRETFALRRPTLRALMGSILVGASAAVVVGATIGRLVPAPPEYARKLSTMLLLGGDAPLWLLVLVVAAAPAVFEELAFRGFVLSGLRSWGPWAALGGSSLLFGLMHGSIYRLLPTFTLGLLLGLMVWRSGSIVCSMLAHLLINGVTVTILHGKAVAGEDVLSMTTPWGWVLAATLALGAGLWLVLADPPRDASSSSRV